LNNFASSRIADYDKLVEFVEWNTLDELNLRGDISKYPFLFSRDDRSDKIDFPEPKTVEKNNNEKVNEESEVQVVNS
jgi:Actin